ncbi:hypothetical protein PFISCL1PPCAC_26043, partial [Pristionchus fissidentatus]
SLHSSPFSLHNFLGICSFRSRYRVRRRAEVDEAQSKGNRKDCEGGYVNSNGHARQNLLTACGESNFSVPNS